MIRPLAAALALAVLAGCPSRPDPICPGAPLADLAFSGALVAAGTPALAGLDPVPDLPDCAAAAGFPAALSFAGTLTSEPSGAGALCRPSGEVMGGSRSADRWTVFVDTTGAVLGDCAPTCAARSRTLVIGDVTPSAAVASGFNGALVEHLLPDTGDCGPCTLPCAARYALSGVRVAQ